MASQGQPQVGGVGAGEGKTGTRGPALHSGMARGVPRGNALRNGGRVPFGGVHLGRNLEFSR